jgi:hypothetical protein
MVSVGTMSRTASKKSTAVIVPSKSVTSTRELRPSKTSVFTSVPDLAPSETARTPLTATKSDCRTSPRNSQRAIVAKDGVARLAEISAVWQIPHGSQSRCTRVFLLDCGRGQETTGVVSGIVSSAEPLHLRRVASGWCETGSCSRRPTTSRCRPSWKKSSCRWCSFSIVL